MINSRFKCQILSCFVLSVDLICMSLDCGGKSKLSVVTHTNAHANFPKNDPRFVQNCALFSISENFGVQLFSLSVQKPSAEFPVHSNNPIIYCSKYHRNPQCIVLFGRKASSNSGLFASYKVNFTSDKVEYLFLQPRSMESSTC